MKKSFSIVSAIISIVLLLFVAAVIGFVFAYVNNGNKNHYVQIGNEKISAKTENIELKANSQNVFYCKKILGVTDEQINVPMNEYEVSIVPNKDVLNDFYFNVDGKLERFYGEIDYSKGFEIVKYDGVFFVYYPENPNMSAYLEKIYGKPVTGVDIDLSAMSFTQKDYFTIVVTFVLDGSTITIGIH